MIFLDDQLSKALASCKGNFVVICFLVQKIGAELCGVSVGVLSKKSKTPQIPKTRLLQHESLKINK